MFVMVEAAVFDCEGCDVPCQFSRCDDNGFCPACVARRAPSKHTSKYYDGQGPIAGQTTRAYEHAAGGFEIVTPQITSFRA